MKSFLLIKMTLFITITIHCQVPINYSHSWSGIEYGWNMTLANNKIYVRDGLTGSGDLVKLFDTSGNLINSFSCVEGNGLAVDYYGDVYVGHYDHQSETASISVYSNGGSLLRSWTLSLSYDPVDNYGQVITININRSSNPSIYILCSDDWHKGTFFKFDRYGNLEFSWEPTEMITSHSDMSIETNNTLFYVLSYNFARIYKYDENGNLLNSWGNSSGFSTEDGEFDHPYGITNSVYGLIAVADTENNRVQFFYSTGTFIDKITDYGIISKKFNKPRCLTMSATGDWLYVLDNNGIHAFTKNPTSISNRNSTINNCALIQNYPNPFNPTTNIKFSLPKAGYVKLIVYDNLGREIKRLVEEYKPAGNHNVEFNAENLSSGIYYYRLTAGEFTETKKMLLLR